MNKYYTTILMAILAILIIVLGLRFWKGEDNWVCEKGNWVKHGNPSAEKPILSCEDKE